MEVSTGLSPIRIGISACLLGEPVRYNGGHVRQLLLTETLGEFVEFVPVCPEVDVGMGVPRPSVRLERIGDRVHMIEPKSGDDWTERMERYSRRQSGMVAEHDLCGFVLKKDSPSCGLFRVRLYAGDQKQRTGIGLFAKGLTTAWPLLPVEEEGRLNDPGLRENFVERIFAFRRLKDLFRPRWRPGDLVAFHTNEKLLLRSHDEAAYGRLGRIVAVAGAKSRGELQAEYSEEFMEAMRHRATVRRHTNVLQHMLGYFRDIDDQPGRRDLIASIEDYRNGLVPLIVPVTLFRHFVRRYDVDYLARQSYLNPSPKELMLRNHV